VLSEIGYNVLHELGGEEGEGRHDSGDVVERCHKVAGCSEEPAKSKENSRKKIGREVRRVLVIVAPRKGLPDRGEMRSVHKADKTDWLPGEHMAEAVGLS